MITHELAKKLKNAGFPVIKEEHHGGQVTWEYPTLSQLIEACQGENGQRFRWLKNHKNNIWVAQARPVHSKMTPKDIKAIGSTPEEAVANLWLELNK